MKTYHADSQTIHAIVTKNNFEELLLSAVYASPNHSLGDQMWTTSTRSPGLIVGILTTMPKAVVKRQVSVQEVMPGTQQNLGTTSTNAAALSIWAAADLGLMVEGAR